MGLEHEWEQCAHPAREPRVARDSPDAGRKVWNSSALIAPKEPSLPMSGFQTSSL